MPLTLSGNGTISDLASAPTVGGTALPTNLSDLGIANHNQITVDSSGRMTNSSQPSFSVIGDGGGQWRDGGSGTVMTNWRTSTNNAFHNDGNHVNLTTGIFTAPVAGRYIFNASTYVNDSGQSTFYARFQVNGSNVGDMLALYQNNQSDSADNTNHLSSVFKLAQGDTVNLWVFGQYYRDHCTWSGSLLG